MTPPPGLDGDALRAKLTLMRDLLDDLDGVGQVDAARLTADRLLRYAVERILAQLVDLAVAVNGHVAAAALGRASTTYRESFARAVEAGALPADLAARLAPSVGLRNVLTHDYVALDLAVLVGAVDLARRDYRAYVVAVARHLPD